MKKATDQVRSEEEKMNYKEHMEKAIMDAIDHDVLLYYDMIEIALVMINQASMELEKEIIKEAENNVDGFHNCKLDLLIRKFTTCNECYNILDTK